MRCFSKLCCAGRMRAQKGEMFPKWVMQSRLNIVIPTDELGSLIEHGYRLGLCQCALRAGKVALP
jgi:hypothetical protein